MRPPRNEYKYLITNDQKDILLNIWSKYLVKDSFTDKDGKTPILSLYYDSPYLDFYNEKLDGIMLRNKIRLRVYDYDYKAGSPCFLEIKQRFGDKVRKIRTYNDSFSKDLFNLEKWNFTKAIEKDCFGELTQRYRPRPTAQVFYIRDAYQAATDVNLRITFDSSLIGLRPEERLTKDVLLGNKYFLMPENCSILEIKNNDNHLPSWVFKGIRDLGLIQRSIPKYITAVENLGLDTARLNSGEYI